MFSLKVFKNDDGYVLREGRTLMLISLFACVVSMLLTLGVMLAVPHMETRREQIGGYLMLMMCLALIGECVGMFVQNLGRRLVIDREGVCLQRTILRARSISWNEVNDLGVVREAIQASARNSFSGRRTQVRYILYVSPRRLSYKAGARVIRRKDRALTLIIRFDDMDELHRQGVFDLCELRVNGGREDADRVTLYLPIDRFYTAS